MEQTGVRSLEMVDFAIICVETSAYTIREFVNNKGKENH
jgi:hypothetical protein